MFRHVLAATLVLALPAAAQERRPSHCIAIADAAPGIAYLHKAAWTQPVADEFSVRIRYVDHSMYLIQTLGGLNVVTDYNGFVGPVALVPDVVTMNNAHGTHWTAFPNPDIPHILPGWRDSEGRPAEHHLDLGEMLVRNATTYGQPHSTIDVTCILTHDGLVELAVRNRGEPMLPAVIAQLFVPFHRGPRAPGQAPSRGYGLGLFIVRAIAEAHGGTVTVDSDATTTTFRVVLDGRS